MTDEELAEHAIGTNPSGMTDHARQWVKAAMLGALQVVRAAERAGAREELDAEKAKVEYLRDALRSVVSGADNGEIADAESIRNTLNVTADTSPTDEAIAAALKAEREAHLAWLLSAIDDLRTHTAENVFEGIEFVRAECLRRMGGGE